MSGRRTDLDMRDDEENSPGVLTIDGQDATPAPAKNPWYRKMMKNV